jgi:apoptosis-inducing factor 3
MGNAAPLTGPDLSLGVPSSLLPPGGSLLGHAAGEAVLLLRRGAHVYAVGATCTHYGSALVDGDLGETTLRCPWHHATFDLRSGEAIGAPALGPLPCWTVSEVAGRLAVHGRRVPVLGPPRLEERGPASVAIVGAGAAGASAAEELRRRGYRGPVTMVDPDADTPLDRPNLSKDTLAGTAPEDWLWLHPEAFYAAQGLERRRGRVVALEPSARRLRLEDGSQLEYGALLLATGADPVAPDLPGEGPPVFTLRRAADLRAIVRVVKEQRSAVVLGASFIGLEVAASLRQRGLEVHLVGPEGEPLARVLGPRLGAAVRALHERKGVHFHLGLRGVGLERGGVRLSDGTLAPGEVVVAGVGVRPALSLAEAAGLKVDRGVVVDARLRTSDPRVWAAGDIARFPSPHGGTARIEHWAVAQDQGRAAARAILGLPAGPLAVPFFWSQHHETTIAVVGYLEGWDAVDVEGSPEALDCVARYRRAGRLVAVATINRDRASLEAHAAFDREAAP